MKKTNKQYLQDLKKKKYFKYLFSSILLKTHLSWSVDQIASGIKKKKNLLKFIPNGILQYVFAILFAFIGFTAI